MTKNTDPNSLLASMSYRPDIDGLRAVAVLLVVLFHFDIGDWLNAGFVGVDIFFVISGFLILPRIIGELRAQTFVFGSFYLRRIRRLAPALLATSLLVLAAGLIILTPPELITLSKEIAVSQLYVSNFYYWRYLNYFAIQADTAYMLHTWSLGVEEQFYMVFPALLWLTSRIKINLFAILLAILVGSFLLNLASVAWKPEATFYLLPTRAWEFAAGGLTPWLDRWSAKRRIPATWFGWGGIAFLFATMALHRSTTPFPGMFALLPVVATVLLLIGGCERGGLVSRVLSRPAMTYVGRISYEIYLVHWPVRIFLPILTLSYGWSVRLVAVGCCVLMAAGIYHLVEQPVRASRFFNGGTRLTVSYAVASAAIILISVAAVWNGGFRTRYSPEALRWADMANDTDPSFRGCEGRSSNLCRLGRTNVPPTWIIYGDSHADALAGAFSDYLDKRGEAGYFAFQSACMPVADAGGTGCRQFNRDMATQVRKNPALQTVVLVSTWRQPLEKGYTDAAGNPATGTAAFSAFSASLDRTIADYQRNDRKTIVWMPVPGARRPVPGTLARSQMLPLRWDISVKRSEYDHDFAFLMNTLARHPEVGRIDLAPVLCSTGSCAIEYRGRALYHDDAHPARSQAPLFERIIALSLDHRR